MLNLPAHQAGLIQHPLVMLNLIQHLLWLPLSVIPHHAFTFPTNKNPALESPRKSAMTEQQKLPIPNILSVSTPSSSTVKTILSKAGSIWKQSATKAERIILRRGIKDNKTFLII